MADITDIIQRARAYAEKKDRSIATISRKLFGNGNRLEEIASGATSLRLDVLERAAERLAEMEKAA